MPTDDTAPRKPDRMWDWFARRYDRRAHRDEELSRAVQALETILAGGERVLDFGCASGVVACRIASRVKEVHGVDTSARMIELARDRASAADLANVRFSRTTVFDRELDGETYDVALAFHVLHLVPDPAAAVARLRDLLGPGGLLVSVTPAGEPGRAMRAVAFLVSRIGLLSHLELFRVSDVRALLEDAGLEVVEAEVFEGPVQTWFAVARKGGAAGSA